MMPRNKDKEALEAQRAELIHTKQQELSKALRKPVQAKKRRMPGELAHQKNLAVFLKIANPRMSFLDIGNQIGETKNAVKKWFREDADVREQFEYVSSHLKSSSIELLESFSMEAVMTLVTVMRYAEPKLMKEAATEILDRIGVAKLSKSEVESRSVKSHEWSDHDEMVKEIRQLPPEHQEQYVELMEGIQQLLSGDVPSSGSSIPPIVNAFDDDDDNGGDNDEDDE